MLNPVDDPGAFNFFTLDGVQAPGGKVVRVSGGDREMEFQNVQQPGFAGAFTIMRLEKISAVEYRLEFWEAAHFAAWEPFRKMLHEGRKRRPARVYRLGDPNVNDNEIVDVACVKVGGLEKVEGQRKWTRIVGFTEYRRRKPIGGPIAPAAKTDIEKQIDALNAENKVLGTQLDAAKKAYAKDNGG